MSKRNLLLSAIVVMTVVPTFLAQLSTTSTTSTVSPATPTQSLTILKEFNNSETITLVAIGGVATIVIASLIIATVCVIQAIYSRELRTDGDGSDRDRNSTSSVNLHHDCPYYTGTPSPAPEKATGYTDFAETPVDFAETPMDFSGSSQKLLANLQSSDPSSRDVAKLKFVVRDMESGASPARHALNGPPAAAASKSHVPCSSITAIAGTPRTDAHTPRISSPNTIQTAFSPNYESNVSSVPGGAPNDHAYSQSKMMCNTEGNLSSEARGTHGLVPVREVDVDNAYSDDDVDNRPSHEGLGLGVHDAYIPPLAGVSSATSSLDSFGTREIGPHDSYVPPVGVNTSHSTDGTADSHVLPTDSDAPTRNPEIDIGVNHNPGAAMAHDKVQKMLDQLDNIRGELRTASNAPPVEADGVGCNKPETTSRRASAEKDHSRDSSYVPPIGGQSPADVEVNEDNGYVDDYSPLPVPDNNADADLHDDVEDTNTATKKTAAARYRYI